MEAGLAKAGKEPFLNSISAESDRYKTLIPFVKKYNTRVVALSLDDNGMTDDMNKVWEVADALIKRLEDDGVPPDYIFVDPLIRPVSTNGEYGMGALQVVEKITAAHPQVHKTCGLSNISYGLPKRKLVNQVFVAMAITKGMDSAIIDPLDQRMMATIYTAEALSGKDQFCMGYITADQGGEARRNRLKGTRKSRRRLVPATALRLYSRHEDSAMKKLFLVTCCVTAILLGCQTVSQDSMFLVQNLDDQSKSQALTEAGKDQFDLHLVRRQDFDQIPHIREFFVVALRFDPSNSQAQQYLTLVDNYKNQKLSSNLNAATKVLAKAKRTDDDNYAHVRLPADRRSNRSIQPERAEDARRHGAGPREAG